MMTLLLVAAESLLLAAVVAGTLAVVDAPKQRAAVAAVAAAIVSAIVAVAVARAVAVSVGSVGVAVAWHCRPVAAADCWSVVPLSRPMWKADCCWAVGPPVGAPLVERIDGAAHLSDCPSAPYERDAELVASSSLFSTLMVRLTLMEMTTTAVVAAS